MKPEEFAAMSPEAQATIRAGILMQRMLADPEAAKTVMPALDKAAKRVNPAHQTVEEQAAPIVDRVMKTVEEKISAITKTTAEEKAVERLNAQIAAAKSNDGFTDEGIANVLQMMKDKGIGDFESAIKAYRYDNPVKPEATPSYSSSMNWNAYETMNSGDHKPFFFPEGVPSIIDNPEAWEKETALKYLNNQVALPTS